MKLGRSIRKLSEWSRGEIKYLGPIAAGTTVQIGHRLELSGIVLLHHSSGSVLFTTRNSVLFNLSVNLCHA